MGRKWLSKLCGCKHRLLLWFFRQGGHLRGWSQKIQEDSRLGKPSWGAGLGMPKEHHIPQRSWPQILVWTVSEHPQALDSAESHTPTLWMGVSIRVPFPESTLVSALESAHNLMCAELMICLSESWSLDHDGCVLGAAPEERHPCVDLMQNRGPQP